MKAPLPPNEDARLAALHQYYVLDTAPEAVFDELTQLAAQICRTPAAALTFIDRERQWHKSNFGFEITEVDRDLSFCAHTVARGDLLVVADPLHDERFRDNPFVNANPGIRFYAGMPLVTPEGLSVGSLCVFDTVAHEIEPEQLQALRVLGHQVVAQLELRPDYLMEPGDVAASVASQSRQQRLAQSKFDREALRVQQRRNASLLQLSLDAIVMMDKEGTIIEWNPAAEAMFGLSRARTLGGNFAEIMVPPTLRPAYRDALARHLQSGENRVLEQRLEVWALNAGGHKFPVELTVARYDDGAQPTFIASLHDITDRKNAEQAMQRAHAELEQRVAERTAKWSAANTQLQLKIADLQRAEERLAASAQRLRGVLESISDAFVALDAQWRFTYVNAQALHLMNKTRDELLGRDVAEGFPGARALIFEEGWQQKLEQGQPVTLETYYSPWKIWLEIHAYPSEDGLSIYFQDISARRADQFALEEATRQADAANAAKSEFIGRISHELRTPLNAILGFGQLLEKQALTTQQHESVGYILKSGAHLLELINEVLDIARIESGQSEFNVESVAIAPAIAQACALMRPIAAARSIELRLGASTPADQHYVSADPQRLAQILINLLSNAIKYNFERGEVEVSWATEEPDHIVISVRDSGPGVAAANLPRLFVPFERGTAIDSDIEGTGLGLALTHNLVEAMGGTMRVESALGRGSTFSFALPRASAPAMQPRRDETPPETPPASQSAALCYSVLCIEDNPSNLRLIELLMATKPEVSLLSAESGAAGLEVALQQRPDLILLDLNLPDMHGSEIFERLQQSDATRDIPVVIVSADATATQIEALRAQGVREYLTKPLDMRRLLHVLDNFLQSAPT